VDAAVIVALIALVGTVGNVALTGVLNARSETRRESAKADATWARYRNSLAFAAEELSNRIGNILGGEFLDAYVGGAHEDEAIYSTLFRFAQYFGWNEVWRRYMRLPDPRHAAEAEKLETFRREVAEVFSTDRYGAGGFMMWREAQRAVGEVMATHDDDVIDTIGVAGFVERIERVRPWMARMEELLRTTASSNWPSGERQRLENVQAVLDNIANEARSSTTSRPS
jgi:hypothetical protein